MDDNTKEVLIKILDIIRDMRGEISTIAVTAIAGSKSEEIINLVLMILAA